MARSSALNSRRNRSTRTQSLLPSPSQRLTFSRAATFPLGATASSISSTTMSARTGPRGELVVLSAVDEQPASGQDRCDAETHILTVGLPAVHRGLVIHREPVPSCAELPLHTGTGGGKRQTWRPDGARAVYQMKRWAPLSRSRHRATRPGFRSAYRPNWSGSGAGGIGATGSSPSAGISERAGLTTSPASIATPPSSWASRCPRGHRPVPVRPPWRCCRGSPATTHGRSRISATRIARRTPPREAAPSTTTSAAPNRSSVLGSRASRIARHTAIRIPDRRRTSALSAGVRQGSTTNSRPAAAPSITGSMARAVSTPHSPPASQRIVRAGPQRLTHRRQTPDVLGERSGRVGNPDRGGSTPRTP